ncbi:MAG: hypothetical protein KF685_08230 [Acidobacteria bacterium]|nr:hypothetical protein [Acidobacteriota bacterium]
MDERRTSILKAFSPIVVVLALLSVAMDYFVLYNEYVQRAQQNMASEAGNIVLSVSGDNYNHLYFLNLAVVCFSLLGFLALRKSMPLLATILSGIPLLFLVHSIIKVCMVTTFAPGIYGNLPVSELLLLMVANPLDYVYIVAILILFFWQAFTFCRSHLFSSPGTKNFP